MKCHRRKKRRFLLLEVMIALALVLFAIVPLLSPLSVMVRVQRSFSQTMEFNHLAHLIYGTVLEELYTNKIHWDTIISGKETSVDPLAFKNMGYPEGFPASAVYWFTKKRAKGADTPFAAYLLEWHLKLTPTVFSLGRKKEFLYQRTVCIVRDIGEGELPLGEDQSPEENNEN